MTILKVTGLCKNFGGKHAIDMLDFEIGRGERVGLIGPNGAGKSTFFNLITGFLRPNSGIAEYEGSNILGLRPDEITQMGIARSFQLPIQFRGYTVFDNLVAGGVMEERKNFWHALFNTKAYLTEQERTKQKALEILEFIGLRGWEDMLVDNMPGGLQRFLSVGRLLMMPTNLLLLDEPLAGLSEEEISTLLNVLGDLRDQGVTIVMIEHRMKPLMRFCDRIVVLNFGRKIAEGNPSEIKDNPAVIEAYLGKKGKTNAA